MDISMEELQISVEKAIEALDEQSNIIEAQNRIIKILMEALSQHIEVSMIEKMMEGTQGEKENNNGESWNDCTSNLRDIMGMVIN